jgi:hypothetical protein
MLSHSIRYIHVQDVSDVELVGCKEVNAERKPRLTFYFRKVLYRVTKCLSKENPNAARIGDGFPIQGFHFPLSLSRMSLRL